MDIFIKINQIRNLTKSILNNEIDDDELSDLINNIYPIEFSAEKILDNELEEIYITSILDLSTSINNSSLNKIVSEKLLKSLLKIVDSSTIRKLIYEKLLEVSSVENPFEALEYVEEFNKKVADMCSDHNGEYLRALVQNPRDYIGRQHQEFLKHFGSQMTKEQVVEEFEAQLDKYFSEKNTRLISEITNSKTKKVIVQNVLDSLGHYYATLNYGIRISRKFEKVFFTRLLKINIDDKILEGIITDRIYGIIFDSKGIVKNFDKFKKKFFKRNLNNPTHP